MSLNAVFSKIIDSPVPGSFFVLVVLGMIYLFKKYIGEKDKEIADKDTMNIVLRAEDETMKALIVEIEKNHATKKK